MILLRDGDKIVVTKNDLSLSAIWRTIQAPGLDKGPSKVWAFLSLEKYEFRDRIIGSVTNSADQFRG